MYSLAQRLLTNPIAIREFRIRMREPRSLSMLVFYLNAIGSLTLIFYLFYLHDVSPSKLDTGKILGNTIFLTTITVALFLICIIAPSLTTGTIVGEKERQTYDMLLITTLSPWDIIIGKITAECAFGLLLIFATLPLAALAFLFGGVTGTQLIIALLGLIATSFVGASLGIYCSATSKTTQKANSTAFILASFPLIIMPIIWVILEQWLRAFHPFWYAYAARTLLSFHPFIALSITNDELAMGQPLFLWQIQVGDEIVTVLASWVIYLLFSAIMTFLFVFVATRHIKPD